jgi:hypothetical protein
MTLLTTRFKFMDLRPKLNAMGIRTHPGEMLPHFIRTTPNLFARFDRASSGIRGVMTAPLPLKLVSMTVLKNSGSKSVPSAWKKMSMLLKVTSATRQLIVQAALPRLKRLHICNIALSEYTPLGANCSSSTIQNLGSHPLTGSNTQSKPGNRIRMLQDWATRARREMPEHQR